MKGNSCVVPDPFGVKAWYSQLTDPFNPLCVGNTNQKHVLLVGMPKVKGHEGFSILSQDVYVRYYSLSSGNMRQDRGDFTILEKDSALSAGLQAMSQCVKCFRQ